MTNITTNPPLTQPGCIYPGNAIAGMEADIDRAGLRWWQLPLTVNLWQWGVWDHVSPAAVVRVHYLAAHSLNRRGASVRFWWLWLSFATWDSEEMPYWQRERICWNGYHWTPFCRVTWRYR